MSGASSYPMDGAPRPIAGITPYQQFCRRVALPLSDVALGQHVAREFEGLLRLQWASASELSAYRDARVRKLVSFSAARVPYYRRLFADRGLTPEDIRTASDLSMLPSLERRAIREQFADLRTEGHSGRIYEMKSSGSTGMQATALLDGACLSEVMATQLLFWSWGGFAMGERHLQTGMSVHRGVVKTVKDLVFRCTYTSAFDLTDGRLERVAAQIDRKRIRALFGYASSLYVIARFFERRPNPPKMHAIFTWGDSLFPHYRELIERVFGCPVNDCYGLGEGLQCAAQCERHGVLHEAMCGVVVEIVRSDGRPCAPGELGRVLVTRLAPGPMPLIRYDTGDLAYFIDEACPCGRALRGISRIQGRATDVVTTPAGDRLIVHFFTQIFEVLPQVAQFQVRQEVPEAVTIRYVPGAGFTPALLQQVRSEILGACRFPLAIDFQPVDEIPLEKSNKRRFVISNVPF